MKRTLFFLSVVWMSLSAMANGDPVAEYCALTLSRMPVARAIPEIQIEREDLQIEFRDAHSRIKVDYVLRNTSGRNFRNIRYGFPVDWEGDSTVHWTDDFFSEWAYQKGWSDDYVTDFSFSLNGKPLPAAMSDDTLLRPAYTSADWHQEYGYPDWKSIDWQAWYAEDTTGEVMRSGGYGFEEIMSELEWSGPLKDTVILKESLYRRWYYTTFSIRARETVTLHVEYTLLHTYGVALGEPENEFSHYFAVWSNGERGDGGVNHFIYDFSPAAAWGDGTAHELNLVISAPDLGVWQTGTSIKRHPDTLLFKDSCHRHYRNFDYAQAEPLRLSYYSLKPDSLDVIAIREHRLPPENYRILLNGKELTGAEALSDLSGCTGVELTPSDSGTYELEILLREPTYITGVAVMNGNCCDSLSWVTNGRAEQMEIAYRQYNHFHGREEWSCLFCTKEWITRYIEYINHPAACKSEPPADFTWTGLVRAAEKVNVRRRVSQSIWHNKRDERFDSPLQRFRILIPKQERAPYISEIIFLYEE